MQTIGGRHDEEEKLTHNVNWATQCVGVMSNISTKTSKNVSVNV